MSGFKQTRQDHLRHGVLSAYLSHNYAKGNFKNSYTKTSGISCNKLHGPDTLKRNIFQRQSSQLSADLKALVPNPFLINHSIFPFQIFISLQARRSAVELASLKLTRSFSMNDQVTLLIYVLFLRHVFHHFIYILRMTTLFPRPLISPKP